MSKDMKPAFYAIIPADVRYDKSLKPNAKLLYGEITALCNERGYCWAGNEYFARLYSVSIKTISAWISQLVESKYLHREIVYKPNSKEIDSRILRLPTPYPLSSKNRTPYPSKNGEGDSNQKEDEAKDNTENDLSTKKRIPHPKKTEVNITSEYLHEVFNKTEFLKKYESYIPIVLEWLIYKKEEKKQQYNTEKSLITWIKKLINFSDGKTENAVEIVETSIANLWEGIFPPDDKKQKNKKPVTVDFSQQNTGKKYGGF